MPTPTLPTSTRRHNWLGILSIVTIIASFVFDYFDQGALGSALLFIGAVLGVLGLIETRNNKSYSKTAPITGLVLIGIFLLFCIVLTVVLINAFRSSYTF